MLRAKVIAKYIKDAGYKGAVCFSCGNASKALKNEGLFVVEISPQGSLQAGKWFKPAEIHLIWPDLFDATSGHLTVALMLEIAKEFKRFLGPLSKDKYNIPTGSGETITCLRWMYPQTEFTPVYNISKETKYEPLAPLNDIVRQMGLVEFRKKTNKQEN